MSEVKTEGARQIPYVSAINEAVSQIMQEMDDTFLAGEDVAGVGGVFGTYRGLLEQFGEERVLDTPISEKGIIGLAVGSAATGLRPIVDIMFMDFLGVCMDEISNQMAKMRYMFGGTASLPITVVTMGGAGINMAAQHSQSLEAWLIHLPGLKVVMPTTPYDAKGLLISAVKDNNPVIVIFNKLSLARMGEVPEEAYEIPLGEAKVVREGDGLTIVALGRMVFEALEAADKLAELGVQAEVIDPRTLQPFDTATVIESVKKTHHALVVHEAVRFGGMGGEIVAQIQEQAFDYLDAPVSRVGAPFCPVPFNPALEQQYMPNADKIVAEVKKMMDV
jgi:pyruvate dehydrogenase E1 component beta subunit